jgi:hypothetical protein
MSSQVNMIMDTEALHDSGPFDGRRTSDILATGVFEPQFDRAEYDVTKPGRAPQGGIDYIDQATGGVVGVREDAAAGPTRGIIPASVRQGRFNGDFLGASYIPAGRRQGEVGRRRGSGTALAVRANSALTTNLPDQGAVTAAFTNPALSRMLSLFRPGKGDSA